MFDDVNGNGVQDGAESALSGLTVTLTPAGGGPPSSVTTNATGDYTATVPAGDVDIDVTDPAGSALTTANDPQTVTVPTGGSASATDVGFQAQGTATGRVFDDVNGNGVQDGAESGLSGLTVTLTPAGGGAPVSVITSATGDYSATVPAGDVDIDVSDPGGSVLTTANDPQTVTVPIGGSVSATDVGFQAQGTATGRVFDDVNGNGVQDGAESGLSGLTVTLTPAGGGAPVSVTTSATGDYTASVPAGDVDIDVTDPAGSGLTTANDPQTVTVPTGGPVSATDVGFQAQGTATGRVFDDVNGSGVQDGGESGLAGLTVTLTPAGGGAPISVTTNATGDYTATVPAGDVDIDVTDPGGAVLTTANDPQTVTVPIGGSVSATDVGFQAQGAATGRVFDDVNGNGVQDGAESGLSGLTVTLTPAGGGAPVSVTTNATGDYTATVPAGDVDIDVTDPGASVLTTANDPQTVTVPTGGSASATDVGFQAQGTATGRVFDDVNGNGVQDGAESGLTGLTVTLTPAGGGAPISVTTNATGDYSATLPAGDVDIDVSDPASSTLTTANDPQTITVPIGGSASATDVGFQAQGTATGRVFDDVNGNGIQDGAESGLAGLTVALTPAGGGAPISVTTNATGDYSVTVPAGDVDIDVTDPANSFLTTANDPQTVAVPTGGSASASDVGFQAQGTATGRVFDDVNGNGVQNGTESGLSGLTVTLAPAGGGAPVSVTTNATGDYSATVPAGDVDIDVTDPGGSALTTANDPQTVTVPTVGSVSATDVGFQGQGSVTGRVFDDVNGNGIQDGTESGLAGLTVTLTPAGGGAPVSVTTNATGDYSATVPTGNVDIDVTDPAGSVLTTANDPQTVTVPTGGSVSATDVGFQGQGSVTGRVFDDVNGSGVQDGAESGLAGITVTLTPAGGGAPVSVITNATGDYTATVPADDVGIDVTNPAGSTLTTANDPQTVTVPAGGSVSATDVGFQGQGAVSGRVFDDVNGNGTQDGAEPGLSGLTVTLTPAGGGAPVSVTTNATGDYSAAVPAGDVDIDVTGPAGSALTTANDPQTVTVPTGGSASATDVGFQAQGTATGRVFDDVNGNGVQDGGESGLPGLTVTLTPAGGGAPASVTTNATGGYSAAVPAGDVDIDVTDPANSTLTTANDPQTVTVPTAGSVSATDVGFQAQGTATGRVFDDVNGNGVQDGGESGLSGLTVTLTPAGGGAPVSVITNATGDYAATVPAGDVDIDVTDPGASVLTTANDPQTVNVPIGGSASATDVGFQGQGTATGRVFDDVNGNGVQDGGESGLSGLSVTLTPAGGGAPISVTTNATGDYSATVPIGDVDLDVTDPAGSALTTANDPQTVTVPTGGTVSATDVGFQGVGTVTGRVFDDVNGNGVQDAGENGLPGLTVTLTPAGGGAPITVTTSGAGDYTGTPPAGDVDIDVTDPAGSVLTTANDPQPVSVPAGGSASATDVGFQAQGTVTGRVFDDVNGNGAQDVPENGLAGVTVTLTPAGGGAPISVTTNATGDYTATVPAGDVNIDVTDPVGSILTTSNDPQTVTVPTGASVSAADVGFQGLGTATGRVFDDVNGNGVHDAGESGLAGLTVTLTPAGGGAPVVVTTNVTGDYTATTPAGDVDIDVTDPAGAFLTTANDPQTVTVPAGGSASATDVGFRAQGSVTGRVFDDVNGNGVQDGAEPGLSGLTVTLTPAGGGAPVSITTNATGDYAATAPAGDLDVDVTDPLGATLTTANDPQTVTVPTGGSVSATDVGFQGLGTVTGRVFDDANGNGFQDGAESGLAGLTVTLTPAGGGAPISVTTNATGDYNATAPAGDVDIDIADPAGSALTTANDPQTVTVPTGGSVPATDVGFQGLGTVTGRVFDDVNGNGVQNGGENGLAGLIVTLTPAGGGPPVSITTNVSGDYTASTPAGDVDIDVTDPAGSTLTTANDPQTVTVPTGGSVSATDVGFQGLGTVSGRVFDDANGNGVQDAGENGLSGLTVTLTPAGGGAPISVTTSAAGDYNATAPAGDVDVDVADPAGSVLTTANDPQTVTVPTGSSVSATDIGFQGAGTVSGRVFDDVNGNGVQDAGENGLAGLTVTLTPAGGGAPVSVTTNATGDYTASAPAGDVDIDVTDPAGSTLTTANDPQTVAVPTGGSVSATDVGFQGAGIVTGHVFDDVNGNGVQDAGENGLSGLTVAITPAGGGAPITVTTNATGDYSTSAPAGDADIDVTDPAGSTLTTANDPQTVTVPAGGSVTATDVGFQGAGTVTGRVFDDTNGNGVQDAGENGLSGLTVTLAPAGGGAPITVTTNATGDYSTTASAGDVDIDVTDPVGSTLTTANDPQTVTVPTGGSVSATDVGFQGAGTVTGRVFDDGNGNGVQDVGEPGLAGLTVTITPAGGGAPITVTTNATGDYSATAPAGDADIDVSDPAGSTLTTANDPQTVTVPAGGSVSATDVGFQGAGTVTGRVFDDVNGNGVQDAGENGLSGLTVTLAPAGGGAPITVTTNATGDYSATAPAGDVDVDVTDPAGTTLTTANDPQTVTVPVGGSVSATDVGFQGAGTVTGRVFDDVNGNGVQDAGENGLSGLTVTLTPAGGGAPITVTTNATGNYTATAPVGDVDIDVTDPVGSTLTTANDPQTVTVPTGGSVSATDVGFQGAGTVTGRVFDDVNGNAVQDAGEPGLGGLTVTLTPAGGGAPITVTTNATGDYTTPASAGDVDIDVTDPAGSTLTTANDPQTIAVPTGGSVSATDVGFQGAGTVTGRVFGDANGNGIQDGGESGLGGLTVTLTPAGGGAPITVTTNAAGDYTATVPAGDVDVDVTDPAGSVLTTANDPQTVTVPTGGSVSATDVGFQGAGTVTGRVFDDANGNGVQDAGESGLSGLTITLTPAGGGAPIVVTTNATGDYAATVPAGDVDIDVTDPAGATLTTANDPQTVTVVSGGSASATPVGFRSGADLSITKDDGLAATTAGTSISYTIVAQNAGPTSAIGATVTDNVPAQLQNVTWTCAPSGGATCPASGAGNISATVDLPVGGQVSFLVSADVAPGASGMITNTATVTPPASLTDPVPGNESATDNTQVAQMADVAVTKTGPATANLGETMTYTIIVTNNGPEAAANVLLSDDLPTGVSFISASDGGTESSPGVITWPTMGTLANGASATRTLTVSVDSAGSLVNAARASASTTDPDPANNNGTAAASQATTSVTEVDLALTKEAQGSFAVGDTATYLLSVRNLGTGATGAMVTVTDTLPAGLTYAAASGGGWSCSATGQVVECTLAGSIPAGGSSIVTLEVLVGPSATPSVTNRASVSSPEDSEPDNDTDETDVDVDDGQVLVLEKTVSATEVGSGDHLEYTLTVRNISAITLPAVEIADQLPLGFRYVVGTARIDGVPTTDPAGGAGPALVFEIGDLAPGASITLTYRTLVGAGARVGDGINRAQASSPPIGVVSNEARVTVRIREDVFTDEGIIMGKVFVRLTCDDSGAVDECTPCPTTDMSSDECAETGAQRASEIGIPGVRIFLEDGSSTVTDYEGRYHFAGVGPRLHVVKVDPISLPDSARMVPLSTRNAGSGATRFVDLKNGELQTADFAVIGTTQVRDEVESRREAGAVTAPALIPGAERVGPDADTRGRTPEDAAIPPGGVRGAALAGEEAGDEGDDEDLFLSVLPENNLNRINSRLPLASGPDSLRQSFGGTPSDQIQVRVPGSEIPADGNTTVPVEVRIASPNGVLRSGRTVVTLESSLGLWRVEDLDPDEPGVQAYVEEGVGRFLLIAPSRLLLSDGRGVVRATAEDASGSAPVSFIAARRPLLAAGLFEGRIDVRSRQLGDGLGTRDRFEDELRDLSVSSDSERLFAGVRAAMFLQGEVGSGYQLTLRYDSEEDDRQRFFRDIRPDELYPIYGDASVQDFDAQSRNRLFARVDKARSFVMFGDYLTPVETEGRKLGAFNRTLNGALTHVETDRVFADLFATRTTSGLVVDELPARGISGPYELTRNDALLNSERVEVITRDRNQPSVILDIQRLQRFADYTIEPFTGRLIFRRPVASLDENLNPISIRVTYEVERGGEERWIYGGVAQVKPVDRLEVGASYARDEDPIGTHEILSANLAFELGRGTFLVGEFARADSAGVTGDAQRVELRHRSGRFDVRGYGLFTDSTFANPSSSFGRGRSEIGLQGQAALDGRTRLLAEALRTKNRRNDGTRSGAQLSVQRNLFPWLEAELGYRYAEETAVPADSLTENATPNRTSSLRGRLTARPADRFSLFGEYEQDVARSDQRRAALGGDLRIANRARLYLQHEFISSFDGPFALNGQQDAQRTVFGLSADYMKDGFVFSEYRVRDVIDGREAQAAIGLRNRWTVSDGLRVDAGFERVSPLGDGGSLTGSTAVTGGLEYTRPESWRGTLRTEYRAANEGDQLLASAGYVRKLGSDWSLLGRSTVSWFTNGPDRLFERTRIGFAWRETESNRWNALGRYEHRYERDDGTLFGTSATRHAANILSFHGNYQSSGAWSIRARAAGKLASDVDDGIETRSNAGILSVRSTVELSRLLDLGLIGRSHWTNGFESHRFGLGVEAGVNVSGLRLYGGYNVFGVSDRDLLESTMSDHGLYLGFGLKFDESVFGLGDDRAFARPAPPPAIRSGLRSDPVPEVWLANRTRQIPEPIEVETDRPLPEPITINTAHPITMPAASVQLDHDRAEDLIGGVEVEATPQTTLSERRARMLARNSQPHDAPVSLSVPTDVSDTTVEVEQAAAPKRTRATQEGSVDERLEQAPVASAQEHVTPPAKSRAWIGNGNEVYVVIALAALAFLVAAWRRVTSFPT